MFLEASYLIRLNVTHSHTKTVLAEQRFHSTTKIYEVKSYLCKKYGTLPEYMKIKVVGKEIKLDDDDKTLADHGVEHENTLHLVPLLMLMLF